MNRRHMKHLPGWKLALAGLALLGISCNVPVDDRPRAVTLDAAASQLAGVMVPEPPQEFPAEIEFPKIPLEQYDLYFVDVGMGLLSPVARPAYGPVTPDSVLKLLLAGPTYDEVVTLAHRTFLPTYDQVKATAVNGSVFEIEFARKTTLKNLSDKQLYWAIGQLAVSVIENTPATAIAITIDQIPQELPTQTGNVIRPVVAADYAEITQVPNTGLLFVNPVAEPLTSSNRTGEVRPPADSLAATGRSDPEP